MRRLWITLLPVLFVLNGCATTPVPLRGDYSDITPREAQNAASSPTGMEVRWGGAITDVTPGKSQTCFIILSRPLDNTGRPEDTDATLGRFIACSKGFFDPVVYAQKREVTVKGTLAGNETRKVGEYEYHYPRVDASLIYLWPRREENYPVYYPYYYPYYGPFYDPFWGPFYRPWRYSPYWW